MLLLRKVYIRRVTSLVILKKIRLILGPVFKVTSVAALTGVTADKRLVTQMAEAVRIDNTRRLRFECIERLPFASVGIYLL